MLETNEKIVYANLSLDYGNTNLGFLVLTLCITKSELVRSIDSLNN